MSDGYADITGHTYTATLQSVKMKITFHPDGIAEMTATLGRQYETEINSWYYEGDGEIMFYMDGGTPIYLKIQNNGKNLYNEEANATFKLVK